MELSKENWEEILLHIKEKLDMFDIAFQTWLKPLRINRLERDNIYIIAADKNSADIVVEKYYYHIKDELISFTGNQNINLIIDSIDMKDITNEKTNDAQKPEPSFEFESDKKEDLKEVSSESVYYNTPSNNNLFINKLNYNYISANLNENYTFDTFVTGNNNSLATAAAKAVAKSPGTQYNPLFIYGGVGLGKTHLMQSIAHYILSRNPNKKVLYITSEFFTNDLIDAIGQSGNFTIRNFREKYRSNDVLLIDDIQFIIGKESTQEEFFHTFNTLYQNKKQIVISSDRPPKEMKTLEDRIKSRFSQGLIIDITPPDYEMRVAILKKKQIQEDIILDDKVIEYIANHITANVRELEGALTRVIAFSKIDNCDIDISFVTEILKDMIDNESKTIITPQKIVNVVAKHYKIDTHDIIGPNRTQEVSEARHICMYLIKELLPDMKLEVIAAFMTRKSHGSVVHGIRNITQKLSEERENQFEGDYSYTKTINILTKQINEDN